MNKGIFVRILFCIATIGFFLYTYISKQNSITEFRLQIPIASRQLQEIQQENIRLQFEIDRFENPQHLMELARRPQFSHLKFPRLEEIQTIEVEEPGPKGHRDSSTGKDSVTYLQGSPNPALKSRDCGLATVQ